MATTLTLTDPAAFPGKQYAIASNSGTVTVARFGTEKINNVAGDYTVLVGERVIVVSDGTDWFVLAT